MSNSRMALSRVNLRDSFVMPQTADIFVSHLTQFAATPADQATALEAASRDTLEQAYGYGSTAAREDRKPFVYQDGFAIIPIHGALINRFSGSWGFVTGYNAIRRQMNAALEDDDVKVIVFDVDSPGGEAAGCFELANEIRAARDTKPILAVVDSLSASAGYALASAATQMMATPSSKIGSIGVVAMHIDVSGALDQAGIKVTFIEAPRDGMKTAGSPYRALDDDAKKEFQAGVDATYNDFVALIVANRGLSDAEVRETKARVFRAEEALALRLIDAVKTPSEAVSSFLAELADEIPVEAEEDDMNAQTSQNGSEATSTAPAAVTQEQIDAAVRADRERMAAVKALPDAAKLPKLADQLATSGYTVEQATSVLAAAVADLPAAPDPAPAPAAGAEGVDATNHLANAMANSQQPDVGAGSESQASGNEPVSEKDQAKAILGDYSAATGRKFEQA